MEMKTRILGKLHNDDVEAYLERNDIIIVPVGTCELHGHMPLDCEYVGPLGLAIAIAEKVDGLVLDALKYFYCGATTIGRGTVQMSVSAGYTYLKEIAVSLYNQGFKRQVYVSGHGPSYLTIGSMVCDFFDEMKVHICWLDTVKATAYAYRHLNPERDGVENFGFINYGAYEISGMKDDLYIEPGIPEVKPRPYRAMLYNEDMDDVCPWEEIRPLMHVMDFGGFECATGFYMGDLENHGGKAGGFPSMENRDAVCAEGLKQLRVMVDLMDMPRYFEGLGKHQKYTDTTIKEKFGKSLPRNKYSPW